VLRGEVSQVMRSYLRLEWNKEKIIFEVAHKDITDSCGIGACIDLQKFSGLRLVELTAAAGLLKQDLSRTPPATLVYIASIIVNNLNIHTFKLIPCLSFQSIVNCSLSLSYDI